MNRRDFLLAAVATLGSDAFAQLSANAQIGTTINKTARIRMLSQRITKAYALSLLKIAPAVAERAQSTSSTLLQDSLQELTKVASSRALVSLRTELEQELRPFLAATQKPKTKAGLTEVAAASDKVLSLADQLTSRIESSAGVPSARLINIAGRQRMLSQRIARHYFCNLAGVADDAAVSIAKDQATFQQAMEEMKAAPVATPTIAQLLKSGEEEFAAYRTALAGGNAQSAEVAELSEKLLATMDTLTTQYEAALRALLG